MSFLTSIFPIAQLFREGSRISWEIQTEKLQKLTTKSALFEIFRFRIFGDQRAFPIIPDHWGIHSDTFSPILKFTDNKNIELNIHILAPVQDFSVDLEMLVLDRK